MAEMYSTFEAAGRTIRFGKPIESHLYILRHEPLMPLKDLLSVTHTSPQYNEQSYQGMFYAESWLLTHYLMNGDNPIIKTRFRDYTPLLRRGQTTVEAFTNALRMPLSVIEADFHRYLDRGQFDYLAMSVPMDLSAPRQVATRPIGRAEVCFHLGDELLRINRADAAEPFFAEAEKIAPNSPQPYEGLGLLALERDHNDEAIRDLKTAVDKGSVSFLAHYLYAQAKFHQQGDGEGRYTRLEPAVANEIRAQLQRSLALMPNYGPAHELLGFFELVQGDDLPAAQQQLLTAIQLEPENQWYLISLAQVQLRSRDLSAARRTLEPLRIPTTEAKLRERAEEEITEIDRTEKRLNAPR
jgi:tetratricopeptide (TPR) repeat protein